MNTKLSEIMISSYIGKEENPIKINELLKKASSEKLRPASQDNKKNLLMVIDFQQDFMDNGSLGVSGAIKDVERLGNFIYNNMNEITQIISSMDQHLPQQIFHPCWWEDKDGNNPNPFTVITTADLNAGKWNPISLPLESREYVEALEKSGKKVLVIWPYHCLQGTSGSALENQYANIFMFHGVAKISVPVRVLKGTDPSSEMYGIFRPEYSKKGLVNIEMLNKIKMFDNIFIAGEAKSHCVLESIQQMVDHYGSTSTDVFKKMFIIEDCMSTIPSFEKPTEDAFNNFKKLGFNFIKSDYIIK